MKRKASHYQNDLYLSRAILRLWRLIIKELPQRFRRSQARATLRMPEGHGNYLD